MAAACEQEGMQQRSCKHCNLLETRSIAAQKHRAGAWQVSIAARLDKAGEQVKRCKKCDVILERRSYTRPREAFAISLCSFGIPLKTINPESRRWYTLTPIDLREEGERRYPIIANGTHCVGMTIIRIQAGKLTIQYELFAESTELLKPSLRLLTSLEGLTDREIELRRVQRSFDVPIDIQRSFKGRAIVFVSMRTQALFDAADARNIPYGPDAAAPEGMAPYAELLRYLEGLYEQFKEDEHDQGRDL